MKEETPEALERFLLQFSGYLSVAKTEESNKLDLFLLCCGEKISAYYDEITREPLTQAEKDAGETDFKGAVTFAKTKLSAGKNVLAERVKLYSHKQKNNQSFNHYVSELRSIAKFCEFPTAFSDQAIRDAFC